MFGNRMLSKFCSIFVRKRAPATDQERRDRYNHSMELALNLVWMFTAVVLLGLWHRHAPRRGVGRLLQASALMALVLLLLPVVSVTDDLHFSAVASETELGHRREHHLAPLPPIHPAALPALFPARVDLVFFDELVQRVLPAPRPASTQSALPFSLAHRPPPVA